MIIFLGLILGIARKLVGNGYGVFALDYPGFGLSDGLYGYIHSFDELVDDVVQYFQQITEKDIYKSLPKFLFGQSMGAAVLVSPMIKIAGRLVLNMVARKMLMGISRSYP